MEGDSGWLHERSVDAVRYAVAHAVPSLAGARVELRHAVKNGDPVWSRGTAWLGDEFLVKYAWSREAAAEVLRGAGRAGAAKDAVRLAHAAVEHLSANPVILVRRRCPGVPAWGDVLAGRAARARICEDLGAALSVPHRPEVLAAVEEAGLAWTSGSSAYAAASRISRPGGRSEPWGLKTRAPAQSRNGNRMECRRRFRSVPNSPR